MAKINIVFNNKEYEIDETSFATPTAALRQHMSAVMNGTGATISLGGTSYNIDSAKLTSATNDFVAHLGTITGNDYKVVVNGIEYGIDTAQVAGAVAELEAVLNGLNDPDMHVVVLDETELDYSVLD